jgi:hypothetical protein
MRTRKIRVKPIDARITLLYARLLTAREPVLERIEKEHACLPPKKRWSISMAQQVRFRFNAKELELVIVVLRAIINESRESPNDVEVLVGRKREIAALLRRFEAIVACARVAAIRRLSAVSVSREARFQRRENLADDERARPSGMRFRRR